MSGTQKKRATSRPALPWLSLCAALALVGVLLALRERSRADGSHRLRTQGSYAPALRQALFGRDGAGLEDSGLGNSSLGPAGLGNSGAGWVSGASTAPSVERASGGGFDSAAEPVSASEAALSDPAAALSGDEPGEVRATTPASGPASGPTSAPTSAPASLPVH